jgi:tRNA1(Val) A37 N6-methylase TrmN6
MLQDCRTSIDTLLGERVRLEQFVKGYRAGLDPVLLAAAVPARAGEHALELGLGAGGASLCLLARVTSVHVTGIDHDPAFTLLARRNATLNKMEKRFTIIDGKVGEDLELNPFDHVFANPPYHDTEQHNVEKRPSHMPKEELSLWIGYAFRYLKPNGSFTLIHRADALDLILNALAEQAAGAIKILPICSHAGKSAKRILVSAVKNRKTPLELLSPLVVHKADGAYEEICRLILEDAAALQL